MSSISDYLDNEEFLAWCQQWEKQGRPQLEMADWLQDRDMLAESAGVMWAEARGFTFRSLAKAPMPPDWHSLNHAKMPVKVWVAGEFGMRVTSFPQAVVTFLAAWAKAGLSVEQLRAADALLAGAASRPVQTLGGYAGTGKTTVLSYLHEQLPDWAPVAFTGKAVDVMRRKGIDNAQTIHGAVYNAEVRPDGSTRYTKRPGHSLAHVRGFLIEEASMVGLDVYRDLLSYGKPIIAVGDHGQLPPVGDDAGLMKEPDYALVTVHRNAGPIARFAEHLRVGGEAREWRMTKEEYERIWAAHSHRSAPVWVGPPIDVPDSTYEAADQIICAFNRTRVKWNRKLKTRRVNFRGEPMSDVDEIMPGDRLIVCRNGQVVFNGQQGIVRTMDRGERGPILGFESFGRLHTFEADTRGLHKEKGIPEKELRRGLVPVDFGYAITCHKAQGDEWDKVVVIEERCRAWEHSRWAYTAASRAKERLVWCLG